MNIIIENSTNLVWSLTEGEIGQQDSVYTIDGVSCGIAVDGFSVVNNANPFTFQQFFEQTFTYVAGVWAIGNQDFYNDLMTQITNKASDEVRAKRDLLLNQTDWTQIPNNPLTPEVQQQFVVYRQALRNVTLQAGFPFNVVWPTPPVIPKAVQPESSGLQQI